MSGLKAMAYKTELNYLECTSKIIYPKKIKSKQKDTVYR